MNGQTDKHTQVGFKKPSSYDFWGYNVKISINIIKKINISVFRHP